MVSTERGMALVIREKISQDKEQHKK
jgi:hypothetical protein